MRELLARLALEVILPVAVLVAAGGLWTRFEGEALAAVLRRQLNLLTLRLFVPALLFSVAATAKITPGLLTVPLLLALGICATGLLLYGVLYRTPMGAGLGNPTRAALMLSGMFGNILFIGYPVVTFLYGPGGGRYPAFADILAGTPLVWTLGVWVATRLGRAEGAGHGTALWRVLLGLPPVWGFALGAAANLAGWELEPLVRAARLVGQATVPVTMFVLGLAIPWTALRPNRAVLGVAAVKLVLMPLLVWGLATALFAPLGEPQRAVVVESAMPTMLMVILFADRFGLDPRAAALMTGWSTLLFWFFLPFWLWLVR